MANNIIKDITLDLFPDNVNGEITASDMRQFVNNIWWDKERKINKYPTLNDAYSDPYLFALDIFLITKELPDSKNGIYVALINQPNNISEIVQVANLTKNDVLEVQTYDEMIAIEADKGDICTVLDNNQTYVFDGTIWKVFLSDISIQNAIKDSIISSTTLWSSKKIEEFVQSSLLSHQHPISDIDGLQDQLDFIGRELNTKIENVNGKTSGTFTIFEDHINPTKLRVVNSTNAQFTPSSEISITPERIQLSKTFSDLIISNEGLKGKIEFNSNGIVSTVLELNPAEPPKTFYQPSENEHLTNKLYVDNLFSLVPSPDTYATVSYVNQQDNYRISKFGDMITGEFNIKYYSDLTGLRIENLNSSNTQYNWKIGQNISSGLDILLFDNITEKNSGIKIDFDSNILNLKNNKISYDNKDIASEEYVQDSLNQQEIFINTKISKFGDEIYGNLNFKGNDVQIPKISFKDQNDNNVGGLIYDLNSNIISILNQNIDGSLKGLLEIGDELLFNAKKVWHENNMGVGSGLDADTLQGYDYQSLPISTDVETELNKKLDLTGGLITGNLEITTNLEVTNISSISISTNNLDVLSSLNVNNLISNQLNVNGDLFSDTVTSDHLIISGIPIFKDNLKIGTEITDNPKILFEDPNSSKPPAIIYDKSRKIFAINDDSSTNSKIWHENNLDVFFRNEYVDKTDGIIDAGKPVKLNSSGLIDNSMLDIALFYFVGDWNPSCDPSLNPGCEYPDISSHNYGAIWIIQGLGGSGYTFQEGDLAGETVYDGDFMIYSLTGWSLMTGNINPDLYYRLDGQNAITANFAGGGYQIKNIADGSDPQDAVTFNQISYFSNYFYARDGSLPITSNFEAGGFKLVDLANGTNSTDAVTKQQLDLKFDKNGSEIFEGDLNIGTGSGGGNIILRAKDDSVNSSIQFNRKDNNKILNLYANNAQDLILDMYDPDSTSPDIPVSNFYFKRTGEFENSNGLKTKGNMVIQDSGLGLPEFIFSRQDGSQITSMTSSLTDNDFFINVLDNSSTIINQFVIKANGEAEINNHKIWNEGNFNPNSKENDLGNPSELNQYLTSDTSGNRSWVTPKKTFLDLDDTPSDYSGKGGQLLGVKQTEDGLEFGDAGPNVSRHTFIGDGNTSEFVIPNGYLPGNIDVYLNRIRQIVGPESSGGDIDASNGNSIIFYTPPPIDSIIEVTAFVKDSFLILPNADENTVGGIKVRIDPNTGSVYITSDGSQP